MSSAETETPVIGSKTPPEPNAVVLAPCPLEELAEPACKGYVLRECPSFLPPPCDVDHHLEAQDASFSDMFAFYRAQFRAMNLSRRKAEDRARAAEKEMHALMVTAKLKIAELNDKLIETKASLAYALEGSTIRALNVPQPSLVDSQQGDMDAGSPPSKDALPPSLTKPLKKKFTWMTMPSSPKLKSKVNSVRHRIRTMFCLA